MRREFSVFYNYNHFKLKTALITISVHIRVELNRWTSRSDIPLLPSKGFRQAFPIRFEFQPAFLLLLFKHGFDAASWAHCATIWMLYLFPFMFFSRTDVLIRNTYMWCDGIYMSLNISSSNFVNCVTIFLQCLTFVLSFVIYSIFALYSLVLYLLLRKKKLI